MIKTKKNNLAFTLIEVLIALSISSFIIFGMIQLYRNLILFMNNSRDRMIVNRNVCLLIEQMQKDLSAAFIPILKEAKDLDKKPSDIGLQKKETEDKKYFHGDIYEDEYRRIEGKKWELFKSVNFISTNPLQIYGQRRSRFVRIKYELIKNKKRSLNDKTSYDLVRKETFDLDNFDFKESEEMRAREKKHVIRKFNVAENIKEMYLEYVYLKVSDDKNKDISTLKKEDKDVLKSFVWNMEYIKNNLLQKSDKKQTDKAKFDYQVPQKVEYYIVFWNDNLQQQFSWNASIPILTFPTLKEDKRKDEKTKVEEQKKADDKKQQANIPEKSSNV
ncbi:hypothetical protein GF322_01445 [Candidatus Dependentiae bacterium]|nr:hypothetical protein [Candidatus Dependentiae bacterium]